MEALYFTITAIALYFFSDWLLQRLETVLGRRLEHRTLYFFFILLILAVSSFALIRNLTGQ